MRLMKYIRKHKKISIIFFSCLVVFVLFTATFGRYIYNAIDNYILETKGFYFNSSVLSVNTKEYKINNWDGVNSYPITVDLNNIKNSFVHTEADIEYQVDVSCGSGVKCSASKSTGRILANSKTDSFVVTMTPNDGVSFGAGESVEINVTVYSMTPYRKALKGKFIVSVENVNFSYEIEDGPREDFMILHMTNSIPYYKVQTAFGNYKVGDLVSLEDFDNLTETQKGYCYSAIVTISFDPRVLFLDMTTNSYLHKIGNETITSVNGFNYVSGYKFKIPATSSEKIIFYKADRTQDYTYPIVNSSSIVNVGVQTAK